MLVGTRRILSLLCTVACLVVAAQNTAWAQSAAGDLWIRPPAPACGRSCRRAKYRPSCRSAGRSRSPSPYSTTGVRLTNASDCGGQDCVHSVGYSYWSNINNHAGSDTMLIFLGLERARGGGGPTLFSYNKRTGETQNLGPLFAADSPYSWATGEGWYFSASQPTTLYMNDGPRMLRYDVHDRTRSSEVFNVADRCSAPAA